MQLAWSLADAASPCLDCVQRNNIFVAIGIGEAFNAIRLLLDAITRARFTVEDALAARLSGWLDAYAGHDDEPGVRRMIRQAARGPFQEPTGTAPKDFPYAPLSDQIRFR